MTICLVLAILVATSAFQQRWTNNRLGLLSLSGQRVATIPMTLDRGSARELGDNEDEGSANRVTGWHNEGSLAKDQLASLELYTSQSGSQDLIASQIANWARAEQNCLEENAFVSTVFCSLDESRVLHFCGWRPSLSSSIFDDFRRRSNSEQGTPAALKESSHMYQVAQSSPLGSSIDWDPRYVGAPVREAGRLFWIDLYTLRSEQTMSLVLEHLNRGLYELQIDPACSDVISSAHVLTATDKLAVTVIAEVHGEDVLEKLASCQGYQTHLRHVRKIAIPGTMTDITQKSGSPPRLYSMYDVLV